MASVIGFFKRNWALFAPEEVAKSDNAIRLGLLGASEIATTAVIPTARIHPGIIVAAVAARDQTRAKAYAKKHKIPIVHTSYQDLLDDPTIDAVYVPLPNGLHYEWAMRALRAGKHVLVEKPFTSNAIEAKTLIEFHNSLPSTPERPRPIMLEAFHILFHPAFQTFLSLIYRSEIAVVTCEQAVPAGIFSKNNIRFNYDLAGGTIMDFGTYNVVVLRSIFGTEPVECVSAEATIGPAGWDPKCDVAFRAEYKFPNNSIAKLYSALAAPSSRGMPTFKLPHATVTHRERPVTDSSLAAGQAHFVTRTVTMYNFLLPHIWHRIDVVDKHVIKNATDGSIVKQWTEKESKKAYTWGSLADGGYVRTGDESWSSYRHMMEQFVNRIEDQPGSGFWIDGEFSVNQMAMIDLSYETAGLPLRPTSTYT